MPESDPLIQTAKRLLTLIQISVFLLISSGVFLLSISPNRISTSAQKGMRIAQQVKDAGATGSAMKHSSFTVNEDPLVAYGRDLISHTALYLGPKGKIAQVSNGMNCQHCHLEAGTKAFAANFKRVAATYPKFRHRSGTIEGFEKRINDCFQRSLNGIGLSESSTEMKAIIAYLKWLGMETGTSDQKADAGLIPLPYLKRKASSDNGRAAFEKHCTTCHGTTGEGLMAEDNIEWKYPPVWGSDSYNTGAGLFRISKFAAFIKANMPLGTSHEHPVLTDEEAWDIAAYVNSMPRPHKDFAGDWPDLTKKPVDHPFGPYADNWTEADHKYGPFDPIIAQQQY